MDALSSLFYLAASFHKLNKRSLPPERTLLILLGTFAILQPWALCEVLTLQSHQQLLHYHRNRSWNLFEPRDCITSMTLTHTITHPAQIRLLSPELNTAGIPLCPRSPSEPRTEYSWASIVPTTLNMCKPEVLDLPVSPPVHPIPRLLLLPETKSLYPHCSHPIIHQAFHFYPPKYTSCFPTSAITPSSCRPEVALALLFLSSLILSSNSIYKDRVICQRRKWVNPFLWLPRGF